MYGIWLFVSMAGVFVVLLLVALAGAAWAPVLAVIVGVILAAVFILSRATQRTREVGNEPAAARRDEREADRVAGGTPSPTVGGGSTRAGGARAGGGTSAS